jgi:putative nucleotidyltransferase with HDIG domain
MSDRLPPRPEPPDFEVNWYDFEELYPWVHDLRGCEQPREYHAEGDVYRHTRLVCKELAALPAWRALNEADRRVVFAAALLHDVAKPACRREDEDGHISFPNHARRGAIMARAILWKMGVPFAVREQVCALVRHHLKPFYLLGEFCREQDCWQAPWPFPSDHARFLYFLDEGRLPDYPPHEDFAAEVVLMSGLPGAGKDHWIAANLPGWPVVSLDELREELDLSPSDKQGPVLNRAREQAREYLRAGRPFVWNATNLSRLVRGECIRLFAAYRAQLRIVYVEVPEEKLERQNRQRTAPVPGKVIERLLQRWEVPDLTEAHRVDCHAHC